MRIQRASAYSILMVFSGYPLQQYKSRKTCQLKSYWDLLNPKWKGKIVVFDHNFGGYGQQPFKFLYYNPELGPEFLKKLYGDMDVTISSDPPVPWLR